VVCDAKQLQLNVRKGRTRHKVALGGDAIFSHNYNGDDEGDPRLQPQDQCSWQEPGIVPAQHGVLSQVC